MFSSYIALVLAIFCLDAAIFVNAGLYVVHPAEGSTCQGGQPCTITWLDDGTRPMLSAIGVVTVGLYTGRQKLVQVIPPVDVTAAQSIVFTPNPEAGPNSDTYYIALTSTSLKGNDSVPYSGFSPFFRLTGMSGSFDSPLPSATSTIPVPSSLSRDPSSSSVTSTITVGTLSTLPPASTSTTPAPPSVTPSTSPSPSPLPSISTTPRLSTSTTPLPSSTSTSSPSTTTLAPSTTNTSAATNTLPSSLSMLAVALVSSFLFFIS